MEFLSFPASAILKKVTEREGYPAAVLIRSVIPIKKHPYKLENVRMFAGVNGPGRVCKYFKINRKLNKMPANKKSGLWIEDRGFQVFSRDIKRGKRIGVDYAGKWKDKKWRFYLLASFSK